MNLPLFIAARYLFAKKSHNVINIISAISAIGMAVGTAALILILSVYNGFDSIIRDNLSDLDPDIRAVASEGKFFRPDGPLWDSLRQDERIESISEVLEDNVFLNYGGQQGIARAKGVGDKFGEASGIGRHCVEGQFSLHHSEVPLCSVGASLAYRMGIRAHFTSPLELYYPDPKSNISLVDPTSSLRSVKLWPKSLFSISADIDNELIIVPIESMRRITGLSYGELSSLEIRLKDGSEKNIRSFIKDYRGLEHECQYRYGIHLTQVSRNRLNGVRSSAKVAYVKAHQRKVLRSGFWQADRCRSSVWCALPDSGQALHRLRRRDRSHLGSDEAGVNCVITIS